MAHALDFGSSKGADFDFPNIPLYPLQPQQTKVFPNAILNLPREFARLFRREEFLAARNAPVHPCIFDCNQNVVVRASNLLRIFFTRSESQTAQVTFMLSLRLLHRPAYFNGATPAFAPAARSFLSSVASGNASRRASSRYAASYAVN